MSANDSDPLIFEMGLYKAAFPTDRLYSDIHFWLQPLENGRTRCGLSAYAARLLTDLFRIDWKVYVGETLQREQVLGEVESTKASSELYSPMAGKLTDINTALVEDPSLLGLDPYDAWLLEYESKPVNTMTPHAYVDFLAAGWDETVKLLKGQA